MGELIRLNIPSELGGGEIRTIFFEGRRYYNLNDVASKLTSLNKGKSYISLINDVMPKLTKSNYVRTFTGDGHITARHEVKSNDWRDLEGNRKYVPWGGVQVCIYQADCVEARKLAEWLESVCENVIENGNFDPLENERVIALNEFNDPSLVALDTMRKLSTSMLDLAIKQKRMEQEVATIKNNSNLINREVFGMREEIDGARVDAQEAKQSAAIANERIEYLERDIQDAKNNLANNMAACYQQGFSLVAQYVARYKLSCDEKAMGKEAASLAKELGGIRTEEGWRGPKGEVWSYQIQANNTQYKYLNRWSDEFLALVAERMIDNNGKLF